MIRKKVFVFFGIWVFTMLLLPIANIWQNRALVTTAFDAQSRATLSDFYQVDFLLPHIGDKAFDWGISMQPEKVLIGKHNWLYLGDYYEASVSKKRKFTAQDQQAIDTAIISSQLWEQWLKTHGVKAYQIIVAPDKDSVYPEYLPQWAQNTGTTTPLSYFQAQSQNGSVYIQLLPALLAVKDQHEAPLYYGTDSHWNALGGWAGFNAFRQHMETVAPGLRWPDPQLVTTDVRSATTKNVGGDLSRFQYANHHIMDTVVALSYFDEHAPVVEKTNYDTGEFLGELMVSNASSLPTPMLYSNKKALNDARVLWVHDSFGDAVSPFMLQSFSSVLQIHTGGINPQRLKQLVLDYKPDYVFALVVERESRRAFYLSTPD